MEGLPAGKGPWRANPRLHCPSLCADHPQCFLLAEPQWDPVTSREQSIQGSFLRQRVEKGGEWIRREDTQLRVPTVSGFLIQPQMSISLYLPQTSPLYASFTRAKLLSSLNIPRLVWVPFLLMSKLKS